MKLNRNCSAFSSCYRRPSRQFFATRPPPFPHRIVLKSTRTLIESKNVGAEEESPSIRIHYILTLPRRFDFYEETATPLKRLKSFDIFASLRLV